MAELKHRRCGGIVSVDLAGLFTLRTHSIIISPTEVRLGVLELNVSERAGKTMLVCGRCDEKFDTEGGLDEVVSLCLVCTRNKPVSELYTAYQFPCVCEDCKNDLTGKGKNKDNKLAQVLNLSMSSVRFTPLVEVLRKPIS